MSRVLAKAFRSPLHAGSFGPSPGLSESRPTTGFSESWTGHRIDAEKVAQLNVLSGLPADAGISILHPYVFGFPLHMSILTHHRLPVPIWRVLQTRNTLVQHQSIADNAALGFDVRRLPTRNGWRRVTGWRSRLWRDTAVSARPTATRIAISMMPGEH